MMLVPAAGNTTSKTMSASAKAMSATYLNFAQISDHRFERLGALRSKGLAK
jgi:hypothetical protein